MKFKNDTGRDSLIFLLRFVINFNNRMKFNFTIIHISLLVLLVSFQSFAQNGDKIEHREDKVMGRKLNGENVYILVGNVHFRQPKED